MTILRKIFAPKTTNFVKEAPVFRFGGFEQLGAQVRPKDERTPAQMLATIDYFAQRNPVINKFMADIKEMNPKHLGLVADTVELASRQEMLMTDVDMLRVSLTGKSLLEHLMSVYPKASKENPKAMEFAQEVINNTDTLASKYFLADMNGIFGCKEAAEHLDAIKPLIKPFAESTLKGGYLGTFEKEANFVGLIKGILTPQAKPEKIRLIPKLVEATDAAPDKINCKIVLNKFAMSDTPIEQVKENIEILPAILKNSENIDKEIDVVDFVNKNVNLK